MAFSQNVPHFLTVGTKGEAPTVYSLGKDSLNRGFQLMHGGVFFDVNVHPGVNFIQRIGKVLRNLTGLQFHKRTGFRV